MSSRFEQSVALSRKKVLQGAALADVISDLHGEGLSILEAVRVIQSVYDISRNEAEDSVLRHTAWAKEAKSVWRASDFLGWLGTSSASLPWLEWYHFGIHGLPMPRAATDDLLQLEIEARLRHAINADEETKDHLIGELARHAKETLDHLIAILSKYDRPLLLLAMQVIGAIGFPDNTAALPWLMRIAAGGDTDLRQAAIDVLQGMAVDAVTPFFLACFLNMEEQDKGWSVMVGNICQVVVTKKEWALACGPAVAVLLAQNSSQRERPFDSHALLSVLEVLAPNCLYALPALYITALQEQQTDVGRRAKNMIYLWDERLLRPYRYHLEGL
ncbi:MAG: hypothetical protein M3Y81_26475 [Chloroflexota bacterium]|nr:hypothetical protein [Chloroflexota bacterium]